MVDHFLPISISNRTSATIQIHCEASSSTSSEYKDSIGAFQTTLTKAIKADFTLKNLEILISIDLEEPTLVKIQLVKRRRRNCRLQDQRTEASSSTTTTITDDNQHPTKKNEILRNKSAIIKNKIQGTLLSKVDQNRKFFRLKIDYYLNSQPLKPRDQQIIEEQAEADDAPLEQPTEVAIAQDNDAEHQALQGKTLEVQGKNPGATEASPDQAQESSAARRNSLNQSPGKRLFVPKFEIFQVISPDGSVSIMILKSRNFSNWMSHLPDEVAISELTIPGSHQSCAIYGWPVARCQTRSLARQLKDGIRFLDIRLALPNKKKASPSHPTDETGKLIAYHGIQSQAIKFQEILRILDDFLSAQPTETLIVSIKRENHSDAELFKKTLLHEFVDFYQSEQSFKSHWWLNAFLPNSLKQVRGKIILFSRKLFHSAGEEDFGIRFPVWPNNSSEIWETSIPNTNVAVQDWYDIGSCLSISKKSTLACVSLCGALHEPLRSTSSPVPLAQPMSCDPSASRNTAVPSEEGEGREGAAQDTETSNENPRTWVITFLSASSLLLGFPAICSRGIGLPKVGLGIEGINSRVARWLVSRRDQSHHPGPNLDPSSSSNIKGVVCLMDFYQSPKEALVSLLVDCNFTS
ncbi:uncharacterized protein PGTG_22509 [Puccinia graminis f. sp. tritici CRL 75-36-700-3]|uniref:Phosphatidylinositol-specific phospholipase C X domain-containing protein n=1 Tax=Puccinia graminis f. sp. tritici (strain CRL 75-36-700-3 / race SCCL) TaxID=418459 RepID=H6QUS4_PUCGT|nr:uncharacterized protein PGTG_22509 [Puccinia graminis f. sp. tritici CRL 75-36-700-3]EHS64832.1 hypothetical protein PGTG_22509 [Puccinia graminis f. sp. tritici CRL 75-36-700-3]